MFELLSENVRKIAQKKYMARLLALYAMGLLAVFIVSIALLAPSYIYINLKESAVASQVETLNKKTDVQGIDTVQVFLASAKAKIIKVEGFASVKPVLGTINLVLSKVGNGISINSLSFNRGADAAKNKILIQGVASSRESLIHLSERLKAEPKFTKVDLPVSSLVKNKDADFSISIDGTF